MDRNKQLIIGLVCAVVVGVCSAGYGQAFYLFGGEVLPGDANEAIPANAAESPAAWDPAEHFVPYWDSISLTSRLYNPVRHPERDPNAVDRALSISGEVDIIDTNGLIGFSSMPANVLVLDQDGEVFYQSEASVSFTRSYRAPNYRPTFGPDGLGEPELQPYRLSTTIPIDPNLEEYPLFLTQVEWLTYALVADTIETVDIPFERTEDWFELTPGLELLIEKAVATEARFEYAIKARYSRSAISYPPLTRTILVSDHEPLAERVVLEMQMLNGEGEAVGGASGAFGSSTSATGSDGQMLATTTGSGSCSDCGQVATIRYRTAVKPYEKQIRFVLEDIPVPSF